MNNVSTGDFGQLLGLALPGFGAIAISGAGGTGKTTLARAITLMCHNQHMEGRLLVPFQFQKAGFISQQSDMIMMDFLSVFLSTQCAPYLGALISSEEGRALSVLMERDISPVKTTIKHELKAFLSEADRPSIMKEKLELALDYHLESVPTPVDSGTLEARVRAHVEATGQQPSDKEIQRLSAGLSESEVERVTKDTRTIYDKIDDAPSAEVLLGWLADYPAILHSLINQGEIMQQLRESAQIVAGALFRAYGGVSTLRNEKKPHDVGLEVSIDGENPTIATINFESSAGFGAVVHAPPLRVARALSYFSTVHISTLNDTYGMDIESTTLTGGMSSAIPTSIQALNDKAADAGARFVIELRDDFVPKSSDPLEVEIFQNRFMASARFAFYLTSQGAGRWRSRQYSLLDTSVGDNTGNFRFSKPDHIDPIFDTVNSSKEKEENWDRLMKIQNGK